MEFSDNKPIYRQITEHAFNQIIAGLWKGGGMIPSVRELSSSLEVNTRTVMKALEELQDLGVITPKRGMGYVLSEDARGKVMAERRREFFESTLPALSEEMRRLGIRASEITSHLPQ